LGCPRGVPAEAATPLTTIRVASGLQRPLFVTHAPGDFERLFVVEQAGRIRIIKDGVLLPTPFLDITAMVRDTGNEQGLLGMAFDPNYPTNGLFYVSFTNNGGNSAIRRYRVSANPDVADPNSGDTLLRVNQPFSNHNGGWIGFGPDGFLYVALGDGGSACDPGQRAQDLNALLGKMLRIDVHGDDFPNDVLRDYAIPPDNPFVGLSGADEVWAYGLRNPWRPSFDRLTGDLWIADVGQNAIEEIDFQPASSAGGENYGWDCKEGTQCASVSGCGSGACDCADPNLVDPIYEYTHSDDCSITGGYVYRGCAIPDLVGQYFFADFCSARIWTMTYDGLNVTVQERTAELTPGGGLPIDSITSFGEDAFGELYICDRGGEIFKIVPDVPGGIVGTDCDGNGRDDACDILAGASDLNGDGVLDVCQCLGDLDGDRDVDLDDLTSLLRAFAGPDVPAAGGDVDGDGDTDLDDMTILLVRFGAPCS